MSDWLAIYLFGCAAAIFFYAIDAIFTIAVNWISKSNILTKNLRKLEPPEERTFWGKAGIQLASFLSAAALSWIQVLFSLFSILSRLLKILREIFTTVPEEIKQLRFPLYNNSSMSKEAVWAYLRALEVKAGGGQPSDSNLLWSMDAITENHPSFSRTEALNHLKSLNAVNAETIANAIERSRATSISDDYN